MPTYLTLVLTLSILSAIVCSLSILVPKRIEVETRGKLISRRAL